ncbi:MAG TPA: ATP-binding cassette domain-containing protein [Thermoanaerobaculia bacterium]|jgi:molybdate transport system ATP-binding protein
MRLVLERVRVPLAHFELDVSAEIAAPVTGIFGPSGAGKTSLLDVIAGLRKPVAGSITLDGADVTHVPPRHRGIGYVPQENALFPHLSVQRNVTYGARSNDVDRHVLEVLEIAHLLDRGVTNLSGGEQKRVALARALLASPRLLLLDEPLAGVDRPLQARIGELLTRIRDELRIPMIYVTHDAEELARIANATLVMERGRVVSAG